jgi:hypothetical protein
MGLFYAPECNRSNFDAPVSQLINCEHQGGYADAIGFTEGWLVFRAPYLLPKLASVLGA